MFVGFVNNPLITETFVALNPPVTPPDTTGTDQLYNVPLGTIPLVRLVGVTVNNTPLQLTVVMSATTAVGVIVTVTVNEAPVQLPDIGVTV